jgi:hypothetical protein
MGTCLSTKSVDAVDHNKDNLHVAGLHPGDTPYPVKLDKSDVKSRQGTPLRRPSNTSIVGRNSAPSSVGKPSKLSIPNPDKLGVDENEVELELYDTCPTPYPSSNYDEDASIVEPDSTLMRIEFTTAVVDERDVKDQLNILIQDTDDFVLKRGIRTVVGVDPDKEDEVFNATYIYRSHYQLHRNCSKKRSFLIQAPEGLQIRLICVSHRGVDYIEAANKLLTEGKSKLEIPPGKVEEVLHCIHSHGTLTLDAPFIFTFIYVSETFSTSCGILTEFRIPKYEVAGRPKAEELKISA